MGQALPKKQLQPEDYHLWGQLRMGAISPYGNWTSYRMEYSAHPDTLFVNHTSKKTVYRFAEGTQGVFAGRDQFACVLPEKTLSVTNLGTGKTRHYKGVDRFAFSRDGKYLVIVEQQESGKNIEVIAADGRIVASYPGGVAFSMNPNRNQMVCTIKEMETCSMILVTLGKQIQETFITEQSGAAFGDAVWDSNGNTFAFLQPTATGKDTGNKVYHYSIAARRLAVMEPGLNPDFPPSAKVAPAYGSRLRISGDGQRVFFGVRNTAYRAKTNANDVQVWNGADRLIYPQRQKTGYYGSHSPLAVWWPATGAFRRVATDSLHQSMPSGDHRHALIYDPEAYEPQYQYKGDTDLYLTDVNNGKRELFLKQQSVEPFTVTVSPDGHFIAYFREGHWWIYNIEKRLHTNISVNLGVDMTQEDYDAAGAVPPCGIAGWSGKSVLLYDNYDLWQVDALSFKPQRLTHGREQGIVFRLPFENSEKAVNGDGYIVPEIDFAKNVMLAANEKNGMKSGYYIWVRSRGEKPFVFGYGRTDGIIKAEKADLYVMMRQSFELSPELLTAGIKTKPNLIFRSNPHSNKYALGSCRQLDFFNSAGKKLKAALLYPANYDPSKQYPMVVNVYEKISRDATLYINPSDYENTGFNPSNFTANGYFVLYPDIAFEIGNPAVSSADCTIAATKAALAAAGIDPARVGIVGHSFGGYQTNFIITQTDLFAAAVSGAGVSDMASWYLTVGWNNGRPDLWRNEHQQWRMGKSIFEDWDAYQRNSPVRHAQNVTTPILLWTGANDQQVNVAQSYEFYLALWRLKKKLALLVYPGEEHVVLEKARQFDLSQKVRQWFDYHLKGSVPESWVNDALGL